MLRKPDTISITPEQCRGARAMLGWSQPELAERSRLSVPPIVTFESDEGGNPAKRTMERIVRAFMLAGIGFTPSGGIEPQNSVITVLEGDNANAKLLEDIYQTLKDKGGEVLIAGLAEPDDGNTPLRDFIAAHIERLQAAGISERILIETGDTNIIAPAHWYRWATARNFSDTPFQLYGDKLAMIDWGPPQQITILNHRRYATTFRNLFNQAWDKAPLIEVKGRPS